MAYTVEQWLPAFLLTLAFEAPIVLYALRGLRARGAGWLLLANGLTHPALWFVLPRFFEDYWAYVLVGEALVFATEALVYAAALRSLPRGALIAGVANGFSYAVGALYYALW